MAIDGERMRAMVAAIAAAMEANRDELCRLDGVIGDADHGIAMAGGFGAARDAVLAMEPLSGPTEVLNMAAKAFLNAGGGSSGPLYATALMRAAAVVKGKPALEDADVVALLQAMAVGIRDRGKAEPGQKTMLDAWAPAALAAGEAEAAGKDLAGCLDAAVAAAREGAEATKAMMPGKGRAERLGERAVGHVDPGAASAVVVIEAIRGSLVG